LAEIRKDWLIATGPIGVASAAEPQAEHQTTNSLRSAPCTASEPGAVAYRRTADGVATGI